MALHQPFKISDMILRFLPFGSILTLCYKMPVDCKFVIKYNNDNIIRLKHVVVVD